MLTDIRDIRQMCSDTMGLFEWSAVPLGNPLRNHHYVYRSWGIDVTNDNVEEIRHDSKMEYQSEWASSDESLNHLIAVASVRAGIADTNTLLNLKIAEYAAEHMAGLGKGRKQMVEIGTGAGGTIIAALQRMHSVGVDLTDIDVKLVEPSQKRLAFAQQEILAMLQRENAPSPRISALEGTVDAIKEIESEHADLVIQNAAIHHESFKDHLSEICRILRPGMPFISGDWHEGTYETPARIYWLYLMLQDPTDANRSSQVLDFVLGKACPDRAGERTELKEFGRMFALTDGALASAYDQYTESERRASVGGMRYWLEVAKIFTETGKKSPEVIIQCHERVTPRIAALVNAGFVFDGESRRKYCEVIKDRGFGELGTVMSPKKAIK